jgi:hypothetical protein
MRFHLQYFHGDTGAGLGASHRTGWTGLVAKRWYQERPIQELAELMGFAEKCESHSRQ